MLLLSLLAITKAGGTLTCVCVRGWVDVNCEVCEDVGHLLAEGRGSCNEVLRGGMCVVISINWYMYVVRTL